MEGRPPFGDPFPTAVAAAPWLAKPDCAGWWIVWWPIESFSALSLVRFEGGICYAENGALCGTPATDEFKGSLWCGPVRSPADCVHAIP